MSTRDKIEGVVMLILTLFWYSIGYSTGVDSERGWPTSEPNKYYYTCPLETP